MRKSLLSEEPEQNKLVDVRGLIVGLFPKGNRPAVRTIRRLTAEKKIPFVKFGGRIMFDLDHVRKTLAAQRTNQVKGTTL